MAAKDEDPMKIWIVDAEAIHQNVCVGDKRTGDRLVAAVAERTAESGVQVVNY
jgi:hypothetical protein